MRGLAGPDFQSDDLGTCQNKHKNMNTISTQEPPLVMNAEYKLNKYVNK